MRRENETVTCQLTSEKPKTIKDMVEETVQATVKRPSTAVS